MLQKPDIAFMEPRNSTILNFIRAENEGVSNNLDLNE